MPSEEDIDVEVPGAVLHAERWPAPAQTVVMLHSGVTDSRSWYAVADALESAADVIVYDRRGLRGQPTRRVRRLSHLHDLQHVLDRLATGPVILVGNSAGGGLALDLALTAPEQVAGLLLLAPAVSGRGAAG